MTIHLSDAIRRQLAKSVERHKEDTTPEKMPRLERWFRHQSLINIFDELLRPDDLNFHLHGIVYDHKTVADGTFVGTTDAVMFSPAMGICETKNTVYRLVGPEVPEWWPSEGEAS